MRFLLISILLISLIIIEIFGEFFIQLTINKNNYWFLFLSALCYIVVVILFYFVLKKYKNLAIINTIWQASNILIVFLIGVIYFKNNVNFKQIIGIIIIIIGTILINMNDMDSELPSSPIY